MVIGEKFLLKAEQKKSLQCEQDSIGETVREDMEKQDGDTDE